IHADDDVVAGTSVKRVMARAAKQRVVAGTAIEVL
ncbi:MAG: hypothetical protein QOG38_1216, partial [Hyphomicrobiales bacterium]|nr:hypothetical protein [Hyphomicrobiales bacterium]